MEQEKLNKAIKTGDAALAAEEAETGTTPAEAPKVSKAAIATVDAARYLIRFAWYDTKPSGPCPESIQTYATALAIAVAAMNGHACGKPWRVVPRPVADGNPLGTMMWTIAGLMVPHGPTAKTAAKIDVAGDLSEAGKELLDAISCGTWLYAWLMDKTAPATMPELIHECAVYAPDLPWIAADALIAMEQAA